MRRHLLLLTTLVLVGACTDRGVASPSPLTAATAAPTLQSKPAGSAQPISGTPGMPSPPSHAEILAELSRLGEVIYLDGGEGGMIRVGLRADAEGLARELKARYSGAVEISVGLFPYPRPDDPQRACVDIRPMVLDHAPLVAAPLVNRVLVAGTYFEGKMRLTNAGVVPFVLETSSTFSLFLFRPGESDPIGVPEAGSMGTGYGKLMAPGETIELGAGGGTASCDLALGYVVPADTYEARAVVDFKRTLDDEAQFFWSDPATVEVVNP